MWEAKKHVSNKYGDKQFVSVINPKDGKITQSREETVDVLLEYNRNLLDKKKTVRSDENKKLDEAKLEVVNAALNMMEDENDGKLRQPKARPTMKLDKLDSMNPDGDLPEELIEIRDVMIKYMLGTYSNGKSHGYGGQCGQKGCKVTNI